MLLYGQLVLILCILAIPGDAKRCKAGKDITADPCGGRKPVRRVGRGRRETCQNHNLDVSTETQRVAKLSERLMKKYINQKDRPSRKIRISDRLKKFLFPTRYFNLSGSLPNYDDIAAIAVFVCASCTQEPDLNFKMTICQLENALIHLLCKVRIAHYRGCLCLAADSKDVPGRVDLRVYPTRNKAARHQRDFMVFRDTASYFKKAHITSDMNC